MNEILDDVIKEIKSEYAEARKFDLKATFYPYKNISHTIRVRHNCIFVRISDKFDNAPQDILRSIAIILFDKLFRKKTSASIKHNYKSFVSQCIYPSLAVVPQKISDKYTASGNYFDLRAVFERVNNEYFGGLLKKPHLGWSLNPSKRRLGFYDSERNLLVVSRIFDRKSVPVYVLEYIMYHEMLHIIHPVRTENGRRRIHSSGFNKDEKKFKEYQFANKWLKGRFWRLRF